MFHFSASVREFGDHGFDDAQAFIRLGLPQNQRWQQPENLGARGDDEQTCRVQQIGDAHSLSFRWITREVRNVWRQLNSYHQPQTPYILNDAWELVCKPLQPGFEMLADVEGIIS